MATTELAFQYTIHTPCFLFCAQVTCIVRFTLATELGALAMYTAVKRIQPGRVGSPEMVLRFRAEAEAAASLHHPNIVPIHETGECKGQHYFSMDYIKGQNLAEAVREGPLPSVRAAQLVAKIAVAVHYALQQKILHRDLQPSNVILDGAGEPHVTDFGLARRLGGDSTLTLTGQVFGSPRFMPPEQASGRPGAVGMHSDVYGLGAILYYLLTVPVRHSWARPWKPRWLK